MTFSPSFFQNDHPKLIFIRLAEEGFTSFVDGNKIINHYLFNFAINSQSDFVDAVGIVILVAENICNSSLLFSQS